MGESYGRSSYAEDSKGSKIGVDCQKQSAQGRHCTHKRSLPVSMLSSCGTGGLPMDKFTRKAWPRSSASILAWIKSALRVLLRSRLLIVSG